MQAVRPAFVIWAPACVAQRENILQGMDAQRRRGRASRVGAEDERNKAWEGLSAPPDQPFKHGPKRRFEGHRGSPSAELHGSFEQRTIHEG